MGNQVTTLGTIRFREEEEEENSIVVIIIAVVVSAIVLVVLMLVFITILYCFWRNSRRKDQKLDELQMTLSKLETNVAHECKEGEAISACVSHKLYVRITVRGSSSILITLGPSTSVLII